MSDERDVVHVYKNKQAWEWHDLYQAALKGWHEEAADLKQQLAEVTQERDKWNENHRVMCRVEHELRQQLVQAQAARTICDVHLAEFDRLEEQLAIRKSSNNLVSYDRDLLQGKKMEPPV